MQAHVNTSASIALSNLANGELAALDLHHLGKPVCTVVVARMTDYVGNPYTLGQPLDRVALVIIGVEKRPTLPLAVRTGMVISASPTERVTPVATVETPSFVATFGGES